MDRYLGIFFFYFILVSVIGEIYIKFYGIKKKNVIIISIKCFLFYLVVIEIILFIYFLVILI